VSALSRQRVLGRDLIAALNRRDRLRVELRRLEEQIPPAYNRDLSLRLDALLDEQDRLERAMTAVTT
jgi:hypothetical protein